MALTTVISTIISLVAGTTLVSTGKLGLGAKLVHHATATLARKSAGRGFFVAGSAAVIVDPVFDADNAHLRKDLDVAVWYPKVGDAALLERIIGEDQLAVSKRLATPSLWGRPTSTIITLYDGGLTLPAEIQREEAGSLLVFPLAVRFKQS